MDLSAIERANLAITYHRLTGQIPDRIRRDPEAQAIVIEWADMIAAAFQPVLEALEQLESPDSDDN